MLRRATVYLLVAYLSSTFALSNNELTQNLGKQEVESSNRLGRDYYNPYDDDKGGKYAGGAYGGYNDYPSISYPPKEEPVPPNCPPNPLVPLLSNGLNFLVLKLGAIGLFKSVFAVIFFVFLIKLPIFLAKAAFFKAMVLPALLAPLMMLTNTMMGGNMMQMMMGGNNNNNNDNKPGDKPPTGGEGGGRAMDEVVSNAAWQSMKFLLDSEKCAERMACQLGSYNNDSASGAALARMTKYIEQASPNNTRTRIRSLRSAFMDGNEKGNCDFLAYPCQTPHLYISQGTARYKVI